MNSGASKLNIVACVVVALLVSLVVSYAVPAVRTAATDTLGAASGAVHNTAEQFTNGIGIGNAIHVAQTGLMGAGINQAFWKNTTGKTIVVDESQVGFLTGTAATSFRTYVSTSTGATIANNFARPAGPTNLGMDGATIATSTSGVYFASATTTSNGAGALTIPNGAYLNIMVQSANGCGPDGTCGFAATSTGRGVNFTWYFRGHYVP